MDKQEIYDHLRARGIWFEAVEHQAGFCMEERSDLSLPYPEAEAKNLFLRDDKKQHYYLLTIRGDKRADLKGFRKRYGTRALSFASEQELSDILKLKKGGVTPFGLLNDQERRVRFFPDQEFLLSDGIIGVHPNDNTATVFLKCRDLLKLIREHGNEITLAVF